MLCQLICVDRRYQRMNCFNIRELQGILKRRFFNDLVNSNDHHTLLNDSMIGVRFKLNNTQNIEPDIFTFYNFGTTDVTKFKASTLFSTYNINFMEDYLTSYFMGVNFMAYTPSTLLSSLQEYLFNFKLSDLVSVSNTTYLVAHNHNVFTFVHAMLTSVLNLSIYSLTSITGIFTNLTTIANLNMNLNLSNTLEINYQMHNSLTNNITFKADSISNTGTESETKFADSTNYGRFLRFSNPLISYDYKCGNYLGI